VCAGCGKRTQTRRSHTLKALPRPSSFLHLHMWRLMGIFLTNPRQKYRLMSLNWRSIRLWIILNSRLLLNPKLKSLFPCPPQSIKIEAGIPSQSKAENTPCNSWRCEPRYGQLCLFCIAAVWRHPGSDDWVCAADCKDKCTDDAGEGIKI